MPYRTKTWCPHPVHRNLTQLGSKPTHPKDVRIINAVQADIFNKKIVSNSEWTSLILKTGDKVCQTCYSSLPDVANDSFDLEKMDIEFANQITADSMSDDSENSDSTSIEEKYHTKQLAKEELNAVFEVLKMEKIRDDRRVKKIREQVDDVYQYLRRLCDILEDKNPQIHDPNPHSLEIDESNDFLHGVKELFKQSTDDEQIRLMTIASANWGHITLSQWFGSSEHQARQAILLRRERNVLAFPEYSRGNKPLDDDTVQLVVQFYLQDGISRVSSNTKDVLKIKNELVPVRFMEMSIQEALRKFYNEYPNVKVGKSMFYSLKPRQVKISSPHETCICQTHENMSLLLHALNNYLQKKSSVDNRLSNVTVSDLIDLMVCNIPAEDCFLGVCDQCNDRSPSLFLKGHFNTIDEDDKWSWSPWKTTNKKVDFNQICGTITSLLNEIDEK
ncbi:unnamed protein product [Rotaria sp. Silwood2]|nr:unnamed protein product [Rotaria sp. Silwood2]CAF4636224.1 unnamed protein product [Rotaria sp. Silwood2]